VDHTDSSTSQGRISAGIGRQAPCPEALTEKRRGSRVEADQQVGVELEDADDVGGDDVHHLVVPLGHAGDTPRGQAAMSCR
jgi:hypothetical protein